MKRASYRDAIGWMAWEDDTEWLSDGVGAISVTACLVADIFDVPREKVEVDLRKAVAKMNESFKHPT